MQIDLSSMRQFLATTTSPVVEIATEDLQKLVEAASRELNAPRAPVLATAA